MQLSFLDSQHQEGNSENYLERMLFHDKLLRAVLPEGQQAAVDYVDRQLIIPYDTSGYQFADQVSWPNALSDKQFYSHGALLLTLIWGLFPY